MIIQEHSLVMQPNIMQEHLMSIKEEGNQDVDSTKDIYNESGLPLSRSLSRTQTVNGLMKNHMRRALRQKAKEEGVQN